MGRQKKGKPHKERTRSNGRFCRHCGQRVFWVMRADGEVFPVTSIRRKGEPWGLAVCDAA